MSKRRSVVALSAYIFAGSLFALPANAQAQDKLVFDATKDPKMEIRLDGSFNKSQIVSPGKSVFAFVAESKEFRGRLLWLYEYDFAGRTGDKTFDLLLITREPEARRTEKKVSVYFDPDTPFPLNDVERWARLWAGCAAGELPKMKMLKLAGNELEVQVLLPDCLKR